jgi:LCP family protein required for cell wall assembly
MKSRIHSSAEKELLPGKLTPGHKYAYAHSSVIEGTLPESIHRRSIPFKKFTLWLIAIILAIGVIVGGWVVWKFYRDAAKITGDNNPLQIFGVLENTPLNETDGRVNILLAGYSVDDPGHQGAELTDSIMIVSVNTKTKTAALISIPRDTWVNIPGFGYSKINAAYEDGQQGNFNQAGYANGGMGLLEDVIEQNFGITTDYYGLLDYTAFEESVNAVGGVTVDIQSPDPRGLYDPYTNLDLPNGETTLNGQQALSLARARGDGPGSYGFPSGDFERTQHQQQLLIALKNKASSGSVITNPLKIGHLADAIGNNVKTDMSLGEMETLYKDTKDIGSSNVQSVVLDDYQGKDYFMSYYAPDGEDALAPVAGFNNFSQIQAVIQNILYPTSNPNT